MNRRVFLTCSASLVLSLLLPRPAEAGWFLRFFGRSLVRVFTRTTFRSSARISLGALGRRRLFHRGLRRFPQGGGRKLIQAQTRAALQEARTRRLYVTNARERMRRVFGKSTHVIRDSRGEILAEVAMEKDLLLFRRQGQRLAFAQWERDGLVFYQRGGQRLFRAQEYNDRVMVYGGRDEYVGQFIQEKIEDILVEKFVDRMGRRHDDFDVSHLMPRPRSSRNSFHHAYDPLGDSIGYSVLEDGVIKVYDEAGVELMKGVLEKEALIFYDDLGAERGSFRKEGEIIVAMNSAGRLVGHIELVEGKAMYFENDSEVQEASSWVNLG